jgi:predicted ATPase/transcriptional regulator with XRE-family HTH domain/Tfp pilus assembly protein PilF
MKIDGNKLRQARLQHFWTVAEAAIKLGVSEQTYIRWEKGAVKPHPSSLESLYNIFQLTPEQLGFQFEKQDISEDTTLRVASTLYDVIPDFSEGNIKNQPIWKVPPSFTSFLGRKQEVIALCSMLSQEHTRLITLLGPGGIGKTRLSLQVATQMRDNFADGAYFISLANVASPKLVILTIAQTLGIKKPEEQPFIEQIRLFLQGKRLLLILDCFEKVIAAAPLVEDLLAYCPDLKILVTSRNKLYLQAEHEFSVLPLALPRHEDLSDLDAIIQLASVSLFVQRAQAILPNFTVTSENAQVIAEICVRLDGLPLAIELAAARIKLFSPRALLERLSHNSQILKSHLWALPERQQTLYNTVKWSYELLDDQEQRLFRSLSVFRGGFTLDAVEAFYSIQDPTLDVLENIMSLLDKSLIQRFSEEPRFTMLETIREYGFVFLQERAEEEVCRKYHARYYLHLVQEAEKQFKGSKQKYWFIKLQQELENINDALIWLELNDVEQYLYFCDAVGKFYGLKGEWTKEQEFLRRALDLSKTSSPLEIRARVLRRAGHLAYRLRNLEDARVLLEESVDISRKLGEKQNIVGALSTLGWVYYRQKKVDAASNLLEECVDIARQSNDKWVIANALDSLGRLMHIRGDLEGARQKLQESVGLARELSDKESLTRFLFTLVSIEIACGDITQADTWSQECIDLAQDLGTKPLKALAFDSVAEVALFKGDYEKAEEYFKKRMELAQELEDKSAVAKKRLRLGELALVRGSFEEATPLVQKSLEFFQAQGDIPNIAAALDVLGDIKRKQGQFDQAWQLYKEALQLDREVENKRNVGIHLIGLAKVALDQKQAGQAARIFMQAESYLNPSVDMYPIQQTDYEYAIKHVRGQLGEETFAKVRSESVKMTLEQTFKF